MVDQFLAFGFKNFGQFGFDKTELLFKANQEEYNPSNVIWVLATDKEVLYVGKTIDPITIVLKDMLKANPNRATRYNVHSLLMEHCTKSEVYFLVGDAGVYSKHDLIKQYKPAGNVNGNKH
ncbi:hypothetical protein [Pedobacter agri]|uniref:hypothetical protein n=1 Tax=Pedobacter agri TaxID=454586 RepID=UPI00292EE1CF|nr:hypothetical protein [Pedobacter agri]